jgi:hypothetical protein
MFGMKRITIARHERVLLFRDRSFETVLDPGVYRHYDPLGHVAVITYDLSVPEFVHPRVDFLVKEARDTVARYFTVVELGDKEVGLVRKNGKIAGVLAPGTRQLYWRGPVEVDVEVLDIGEQFEIAPAVAAVLTRATGPLALQVADAVKSAEVPDTATGLLIVDGKLTKVLEPGVHAFWQYRRRLSIEIVDRRVQLMEVADQEVLTRDKVSLRVNLTALWQVLDAVKARAALTDFGEFLYKELQFALRVAVGPRVLDELLGEEGALDREIRDTVSMKLAEHGLAVRSVGVELKVQARPQ